MTKDDLNTLVIPALRYGLGRRTYITGMIADCLIRNKKDIHRDIRDLIVREIKRAIEEGNAGMQMDVDEWNRVIEVFDNE